MSTGHLLPGYTDPVSRFARARNALYMGNARPAAQNLKELQMIHPDPVRLEEIRKRAKEVWQHKDTHETSYQGHFRERFSAVDEPTPTRPTSPNRHNKPHPKEIFLTTRLHFCPGYHNPDAQMGKARYQVDASTDPIEWESRTRLREKYIPSIHSAALAQYKEQFPEEIEGLADPIQKQVAKAEYKVAPPREQLLLINQLRDAHNKEVDEIHMQLDRPGRPQTVPALNRYMKFAGADERNLVKNIEVKFGCGDTIPPVPLQERSAYDLARMRPTSRHIQKSRRGDFLIHPQWPPSMVHHRLNGLSSVDLPYLSNPKHT